MSSLGGGEIVGKGPIRSEWLHLGEYAGVQHAVRFVLWDSRLVLEKQEKQGDEWVTVQQFALSRRVLTELFARIPVYLDKMFKYGEKVVRQESQKELSGWKEVPDA